jgi:hypothetical protein
MKEYVCGPLFFRECTSRVPGHCHNFDHVTLIIRDRWQGRKWVKLVNDHGEPITVDGQQAWKLVAERVFHPGERVLIEAGAKHDFVPVGDAPNPLALCIYPHRTPEGEVVTHETGFQDAYEQKVDGPHGFDPHPRDLPPIPEPQIRVEDFVPHPWDLVDQERE